MRCVPFARVNRALDAEFKGVVKLRNHRRYPFVLYFRINKPPAWMIDRATAITKDNLESVIYKVKRRKSHAND